MSLTMEQRIEAIRKKRAELLLGGGADKLEKHRAAGKLTARERVDALVDPGSFMETGLFAEHRATMFGMAGKETPADGVVTGAASMQGRLIHLAARTSPSWAARPANCTRPKWPRSCSNR